MRVQTNQPIVVKRKEGNVGWSVELVHESFLLLSVDE